MKLGHFKEDLTYEHRIATTPDQVKKYIDLGIEVVIESGLGHDIYSDEVFTQAGATVTSDINSLLACNFFAQVNPPRPEISSQLTHQHTLLCFMNPFSNKDVLSQLAAQKVTVFSVELIPRITRAQKMDGLSSQASLAGYASVILASDRLHKVLPMMMTPAGTLPPSKLFVIGAGVAGLQAIATGKRLGARVDAFDTRPAVEEQVQSLGAKFLKVDLGDTGETDGGYAKQLTEEQLQQQRDMMAKACAQSDIVITTAQVFGRQAPRIITDAMIKQMNPGSIIVDMAVETGGNVEGSQLNQEVLIHGVHVIGYGNLTNFVSKHASDMYASNCYHFIHDSYDTDAHSFQINLDNEVISGALTVHKGDIVHPMLTKKEE